MGKIVSLNRPGGVIPDTYSHNHEGMLPLVLAQVK